jgi:hypothetical protein
MMSCHDCPWVKASSAVLLALGLLCGSGCDSKGIRKVRIHGRVTLDGEPVPAGSVKFSPLDGQTPTAGAVIQDGEYRAEVPLGRMRVEIRAARAVEQPKGPNAPQGPHAPVFRESIPRQFNEQSQLTRDIEESTSEVDFDLKSRG